MADPTLSDNLIALSRMARGNGGSGLTVIGCAYLAQELRLAGARALRLEERAQVAEAMLIDELPPETQGELTDGAVVVFPRQFSRDFTIGLHGDVHGAGRRS